VHRYGHCWRCHTPILFRGTEQWFLRVEPLKPKMVEEIKRVRWTPEWAGSARQMEWTQNLRDWTISRQRYWGTPLPLWICEKCGDLRVIGSAEELKAGQGYREGMDLHRPWIDAVTFRCAKCGSMQRRVKDVLDVWFDSGVASWAQLDYPRNKDAFKRWWPVDWIVEGNDQTRGWFNSQMWAGVIAFDRAPYESVLLHGWMNGPDGRQMHKSLGNYIEPFEVVAKHGVDALRLYLVRANAPWEDITFSWEDVKNAGRILNILYNVHRFATTYMAMDRFDPLAHPLDEYVKTLTPADRWLLSRMERLKETVTGQLEAYELQRAARSLEEFIAEDLSRWYVKMVRDRTWKEGEDRGKLAAYKVLHEALRTTAQLLAPICPHVAEEIYQDLDGRLLSVHMSDWPKAREDFLNANLEKQMSTVRDLVDIVAKVRQKENVKLRWPVRAVTLRGPTEDAESALRQLRHVVLEMANVKEIHVLPAEGSFAEMELTLLPDPQAIGKAYKAWWSKIATMLEMRTAAEVQRELQERGEYRMGIEGQIIKILPNMVRIEHRLPKGVVRVETPYGELFIDLRVTDEIRAEGMAREVVRGGAAADRGGVREDRGGADVLVHPVPRREPARVRGAPRVGGVVRGRVRERGPRRAHEPRGRPVRPGGGGRGPHAELRAPHGREPPRDARLRRPRPDARLPVVAPRPPHRRHRGRRHPLRPGRHRQRIGSEVVRRGARRRGERGDVPRRGAHAGVAGREAGRSGGGNGRR
ncbi:MAG: class I tRNA ligase family protein, partial [Candidatus Thermoplasmatota archaeon]